MPVGGGDVRAAVWSRLHSRRGCRQRACHPQRRGRHRVSGCSWYLPGTTSAEKQKNVLSMQMAEKTGDPARKCRVRNKSLACLIPNPSLCARERARLDELLCRGHALLKCSVRLSGCAGDTDERVDGWPRREFRADCVLISGPLLLLKALKFPGNFP